MMGGRDHWCFILSPRIICTFPFQGSGVSSHMLLKHLDALSGEFHATPAGKPASQRPALRVFLPGKALLMGEVGGGRGGGEEASE